MCSDDKNYYSSSSHGLVYAKDGTYKIHNLKFIGTQVGGVKVDNANATLINTSFVEDTVEKNKNFNGEQIPERCNFGVVQSGECNIVLSNKWILPGIPDPIISRAKLTVNVLNEKERLKFDIEGEQIYPLNFQNLTRDGHGMIIWPPKDATELPLRNYATVHGSRNAFFSMRDYTWL
ncbi:MAG: hypothetical protein EZS28_045940, partial [Streblomastix strix]